MTWVTFAISAVVIVLAAIKLAEYGDVISIRTRLGGLFVGTLLLSTATSLPELLTTLNSINQDVPSLAIGNVFGSSMFNMFLLAVMDVGTRHVRLMHRVAFSHTLTATLAVMLTGLSVFFILANLEYQVGWVGVDSLVILGMYVVSVRLIQLNNLGGAPPPEPDEQVLAKVPPLRTALIGFGLATLALIVVTPLMVGSAADIAEQSGLSAGFIGSTLVAFVTSLPEVVTTVSAVRVGAYDLAVGNLFGSNLFNIFALGIADVLYLDGRLIGRIEVGSVSALSGVLALVLTTFGIIGILSRVRRRRFSVNMDTLLIFGYLIGMWLLYDRGVM